MAKVNDIVVAVDFNTSSQAALVRAERFAQRFSAAIHVVHGIGSPSASLAPDLSGVPAVWDATRQNAASELDKIRQELEQKGLRVTARVSELDPVRAVLSAADADRADLILMGTHGYKGFRNMILGSVAEGVLRKAPCPVMAVKEEPAAAATPIERVVVATDLSENSEPAVAWAFQFAAQLGARVDLVHVFSFRADAFPHTEAWRREIEEKEHAALERTRAQCDRHRGEVEQAEVHILKGDAPPLLVERFAEDAGAHLIAMGTHAYTGFARSMRGSVAEETLRRSKRSVAVIRGE